MAASHQGDPFTSYLPPTSGCPACGTNHIDIPQSQYNVPQAVSPTNYRYQPPNAGQPISYIHNGGQQPFYVPQNRFVFQPNQVVQPLPTYNAPRPQPTYSASIPIVQPVPTYPAPQQGTIIQQPNFNGGGYDYRRPLRAFN